MSEKAMLIATATINPSEMEAMKFYQENTAKLLMGVGGQLIGKFNIVEKIAGNNTPQVMIQMEFPNLQIVKDTLASEEYQKLIPFRDKAFSTIDIYLANV